MRSFVVSGGAGGIGREIAESLLVAGDQVAVWDIGEESSVRQEKAFQKGRGRILRQTVDVSQADEVQAALADAYETFKRIDGLVTCAGIADVQPFMDLSQADWDRMLNINLRGTFLCVQAVARVMNAQRSGRIVCIASVAALDGSPGHSHYAAAKAGIIGMTKALAKELGPMGITINTVSPGAIKTPMIRGGESIDEEAVIPPEVAARYAANPIGRIGMPKDVAGAVTYLLSDAASFVTGIDLIVSGGI